MLGSLLSGPLHLGHILLAGRLRRPTITPIAVGLLVAALFVLGRSHCSYDPIARQARRRRARLREIGKPLDHFRDHAG